MRHPTLKYPPLLSRASRADPYYGAPRRTHPGNGGDRKTLLMFYGWKIVAVTFVTLFISVGFSFYSFGVFFPVLVEEFGGSHFSVSLAIPIMNIVTGILAPFLGRALDRGSVRRIMILGAVLMALGLFQLSFVQSIWYFYFILAVFLGVGAAMLGPMASSTLVARWFMRRRGTALGIATMGISLSGVVMVPLAMYLITTIGWRITFILYGITALVLVVPLVRFFVIDRPEDIGLNPDGAQGLSSLGVVPPGAALDTRDDAWSALETMRNRNFWIITLVVGLNFCANGAILIHIVDHVQQLGFSDAQSPWVLSAIAAMGVVGKILFGWIADFIDKRAAFWLAMTLQISGAALFSFVQTYPALIATGAIFGLGMGGIVPLWGSLIGAAFGRNVFGRVMGLMSPCMLPIQSAGIPFAGYIFDEKGSYIVAFQTFIIVYLAAMAVLAFLRLPKREPGGVIYT